MDWLQAIGPAFLMVLGGVISWIVRSWTEELRAARVKLREQQRKVYAEILDPYIRLFADLKTKGAQEAAKRITSYEYRQAAFELNLFGSDTVVRAYNSLLAHAYEAEASGQKDPVKMMLLWGGLLLEIRRSVGHKRTRLNELDMLRTTVKDLDSAMKD
ncbi:MAG TPA: hypothetical protein ENN53_03610 [Candidatus Acetothermia bacterium]|nr:hypothetical protein [Candidatus Acetothermia bacterium]